MDSISDMVDEFCAQEDMDSEDLRFYLTGLIDEHRSLRRGASRCIASIIGLAALFGLLATGGISEAEVFGVKVKEFSWLLLAIPVAIAYLFLRAGGLLNTCAAYQAVYGRILRKTRPNWRSSELHSLLLSDIGWIGYGDYPDQLFEPGLSRRLVSAGVYGELTVFIISPIAFTIVAYIQVFNLAGVPLWATLASLLLSVIILLYGFTAFVYVSPSRN